MAILSNKQTIIPRSVLIIIISIFAVILLWGLFGSDSQTLITNKVDIPKQDKKLDDIGAYIEAKDYIEQILKAPATAEFPPLGQVNHLVNNRYEVISHVDSQNSFGAMLRSDWKVIFQYQNGKKYLEKMVFDGEVIYPAKEQVAPSKSNDAKEQTAPAPVSRVSSAEQQNQNSTSDRVVLFGEKVKLSDKIITVYSVGEYVAKYSTPREGYRFIYVDAEIENLTDEDIICMLFDLADDKGNGYERGYPTLGSDSGSCVTVSPYKKGRGYSIFEVPQTREYFQVKYANVLGDMTIDPLHIIFKPGSGWKLGSRVQS